MQFQYNADYPGLSAAGPTKAPARNPPAFPPAQPTPCARITTRVYHPSKNQVATVQNVLVSTAQAANSTRPSTATQDDNDSFSSGMSSSSSSFSSSDDGMKLDDGDIIPTQNKAQQNQSSQPQNAYWLQRTIRDAIYGRVLFAVVLKRRQNPAGGAEWEVTTDHCAVKELSWQHIRKESGKLAEDPIKEVSAMQYLQKWFQSTRQHNLSQSATTESPVAQSFRAMRESNIMMPLDLLSDERNLYSIMPYCDGGELFERLDLNERFSEEEARYWMDQVLNVSGIIHIHRNCVAASLQKLNLFCFFILKGIENMQHVGICHRDMSLENLLVHKDGALIIDMGMCLLIPDGDPETGLASSFNQMSMNGGQVNAAALQQNNAMAAPMISRRGRPRQLIQPQGTCGKWIYMSPEIYQNSDPFDGYAVDMWAAGVILFLMLTGFPPWERACPTDERFHYMTAGYLVQMLTEWEIGLSSDSLDLLQRMLFLDPKDRLSLDQVRAHPWMSNGRRARPEELGS